MNVWRAGLKRLVNSWIVILCGPSGHGQKEYREPLQNRAHAISTLGIQAGPDLVMEIVDP